MTAKHVIEDEDHSHVTIYILHPGPIHATSQTPDLAIRHCHDVQFHTQARREARALYAMWRPRLLIILPIFQYKISRPQDFSRGLRTKGISARLPEGDSQEIHQANTQESPQCLGVERPVVHKCRPRDHPKLGFQVEWSSAFGDAVLGPLN